ncbi:MAG: GPW/gp25 family protein [Deltaproteobacteria bacterium]|nr:GPW/gp25 family protein [Deltaproteobacteria bacterium]
MLRKDFLGRGWKFPFQFDAASGGIALSEYEQNIKECMNIILGTRPGERQMLPEFGCGVHKHMFAPSTRATAAMIARQVERALARWEPRIEVTNVDAWPDVVGQIKVNVEYNIRATLSEQELALLLTSGG